MHNCSVAAVTASRSVGPFRDWRGQMVAYIGEAGEVKRDLDMNDFRHLADHFSLHGVPPRSVLVPPGEANKVLGVRINCIGDQRLYKRPVFEQVEIGLDDGIFESSNPATELLWRRVEFPIATRKLPLNINWTARGEPSIMFTKLPWTVRKADRNEAAEALHISCDPQTVFDFPAGALGWGWPSKEWTVAVGSVIVVRRDGRPLLPLHVEALSRYVQDEVQPLFRNSGASSWLPKTKPSAEMLATRKRTMDQVTQLAFMTYWAKFCWDKASKGENVNIPGPYDE